MMGFATTNPSYTLRDRCRYSSPQDRLRPYSSSCQRHDDCFRSAKPPFVLRTQEDLGACGMKLHLHRWAYVILCVLACVTPLALILIQHPSDVSSSAAVANDTLLAAVGNLAASVLTYPAGVVGSIASYALIYVGVATPTETVLCASPLYLGA